MRAKFQISFWQAYNTKESSPFRDTNYNPEIFYRFKERPLGRGSLGADAGFEHESNGQRVPLSRSWNLLYLAPFYHMLPHGHLVHLLVRGYLGTSKGNVSLNYSIPMTGAKDSFLVARLFSGYGESMLDYKRSINRIGVGVMFNR